MKRRRALARLCGGGLVGLCGCVSAPSATRSNDTTASGATDTPADDLQRRISLRSRETVPARHRIAVETTVLEPTITDSHTARIQIEVTNEGPARELSVSTGRCALFNRDSQTSRPRGVWLGLADDPGYASQTGPRWVASPPEDGAFPDYGCAGRTYRTGESVSEAFALFDDSRVDGYLEAGTYRFEEEIVVTPLSEEADDEQTVRYRFSIRLENPNCTLCL